MTAAAGAAGEQGGAGGAGGAGGGGQTVPAWASALPEGIRGHALVGQHETVESFVKWGIGANEAIGRKGVLIPGKEAKPDEVAAYRKAMGVPESAEKYDLSGYKPPEGFPWDQKLEKRLVAKAHALNVPQEALAGLRQELIEAQVAQLQEYSQTQEQGRVKTLGELKAKYGATLPVVMRKAEAALAEVFGDRWAVIKDLPFAGAKLRDHPDLVTAAIKMGQLFEEHGLVGDKSGAGLGGKSPEQAKGELEALKSNQEAQAAIWDSGHPQHAVWIEKRNVLYAQAYPEGSA